MADEISIGKQAIKEVQDLRAELVKLSEDALKAGKNMQTISTPSALNKNGADNAKMGAELDALKVKYVSLNDSIVKKAEQSRLAEIRLQQQREKSFDSFDRNAKKEQAQLEKTNNAYNKTQTQINNLTKAYNDLAVRKARYNDLNTNEEMRLGTLAKVNEKYNGLLKGTDAIIGKATRNVGNYTTGYNALGNSINQLSREAPAFANSINTGFMALSNNFPALFDAINGIRAQNALLVAEGKPTTSLFKQLVGGIFSWQTLLSVGVTLLTLYGGKIVEWVSKMANGTKGINAMAEAQKALNNAKEEANKNTTDELTHLEILRRKTEDTASSMHERKEAAKEMQELYPSYLGNMSIEQIMAGKTGDAYKQLTKDILAASTARAIEAEMTKLATEQLKLEKELREGESASSKAFNLNIKQQLMDAATGGGNRAAIKGQQDFIKSQNEKLAALAKEREILMLQLLKINSGNISQTTGKDDKIDDKKTKTKKEDTTPKVQQLESSLKSVRDVISQINEEIDRLTSERIVSNDSALPAINFQLTQLKTLKEQLNGMPEVDLKIVKPAVKSKEAVKQLSDEMKNYLKSFSEELASNTGFTETFAMLNDEIEGFGENWQVTTTAIMESAQEVFNFISNASQKNFDAEKERLQNQYDISLKFAGDNVSAKEQLAKDLEKKQKEIDYREAKAKQKQAIFNIAIDTAQAVVAVLPNFYLAAIVAAFGVAQGIAVASEKIPQYWMGGTHDGGLMMVNDGGGSNFRETIVTPDGQIHKPQGKNVIMNAPIGTEIFTHDQWQKQMDGMLQGNGINWHNKQQSNGMTSQEMDAIMSKHFSKIQVNNTSFDKRGIRQWSERNGNKTINNNARGSGRGFNV